MKKISSVFLIVSFLVLAYPQTSFGRTSPLKNISYLEQKNLIEATRAQLEQQTFSKLSPQLSQKNPSLIFFLFDDQGQLLSKSRQDNPRVSLADKITAACATLTQKKLEAPLKKTFLHLLNITHTARLANFGSKAIFDNNLYEPQVTGISFILKGKKAELTPVEATLYNLGPKGAVKWLTARLGLSPETFEQENDLKIEIYKVQHFGETYPDHQISRFHRGHVVVEEENLNQKEIQKRLELIGQWYKNNTSQGEVTYIYYPASQRFNNKDRTMVRSTMAVWTLNQLAHHLNDKELKTLGQDGIDFYLNHYFNISESLQKNQLIPSSKPSQRGELAKDRFTTAGFLILSLLEQGKLDSAKNEITLLASWLMTHQQANGLISTDTGESQFYMPGQLLLAISTLFEKTKEPVYIDFLDKSLPFYQKQLQEMLQLGNKRFALIAPAWFTQPFTKMYFLTGQTSYKKLVFGINDRVVRWYEINSQDQIYSDYDGILLPEPDTFGHTAITAAALESLVDAALLARQSGDSARFITYSRVIKKTLVHLFSLQFLPENTYYIKDKQRVIGGFKSNLINSRVWMDNVWHLTNALMKIDREQLIQ